MCLFCKKKKKNYTALKVVAAVISALAAVAAAYVIFDKFFKDKLMKKLAKKNCACVEESCEDVNDLEDDDVILEVTEAEVYPEEAETPADAE